MKRVTATGWAREVARRSAMIEVSVELRGQHGKSMAVWSGVYEDREDPRTGEIAQRERWHFLPASQVTVLEQRGAPPNVTATIEMPEWLAKREGLI